MHSIREVIIVEGRYDKNTLSQVVDATIIDIDGFGIYNNREKQKYIRKLADSRGIIVLTDSDGAGFMIRNFIKGCVEPDKVKQAFIPDIYGKEKRKSSPSKEGKLGVEGMKPEILLDALRKAGASFDGDSILSVGEKITKADMYAAGLSGRDGSSEKRAELIKKLDLPSRMTAESLLDALNALMTREEFHRDYF